MSFPTAPTTFPASTDKVIRYLTQVFSDELIELSQIAQHAPFGITDTTLAPGWYFTVAGSDALAYVDRHSANTFKMRNFVTVFHKTAYSRSARFALGVTLHYDTQELLSHWVGFTAAGPNQILEWPDVWTTILFPTTADPLYAQ